VQAKVINSSAQATLGDLVCQTERPQHPKSPLERHLSQLDDGVHARLYPPKDRVDPIQARHRARPSGDVKLQASAQHMTRRQAQWQLVSGQVVPDPADIADESAHISSPNYSHSTT